MLWNLLSRKTKLVQRRRDFCSGQAGRSPRQYTDDDWMIAKTVSRVSGLTIGKENYDENKKG
jgi:hypothetical protein